MKNVDIAVIGGGFSAAATIVNLMEVLEPEQTIGVVGRSAGLGLGIAYGLADEIHRLNVPAGRMSLFPDSPDHLCDWLKRNGHDLGAEDFIPRRLFGAYVQDTLETQFRRADNRVRLHFHDAEAIDCETLDDQGQVFHLSNGEWLASRASVFCIGGTPAGLPLPDERIAPAARPHLCLNVWADQWLDRARPNDTIFMLGSGLTMVDQVMSLRRRGHRGRIHVVSRHGLVPQPHQMPRSDALPPAITPGSGPLSEMMRHLRAAARRASDWRSAVDGIRPVTQAVWQNLPIEDRRRFLRHANALWNVHRHRLSPEIRADFDEMRDRGQVTISAGWLHEIYAHEGRARVAFRDRHSATLRQVSADWVVNCTGMEKCSISKVPLLKKMLARGMISADALGLGIAVNGLSQVQREDGTSARATYALGPMTTGQFFEILAVPDIRVQAKAVAGRIAANIAPG